MASKTINQLDTIDTVSALDELPIYDVSEDTTKKITKSTLLDGMQEELTFDEAPTEDSTNPVTSGGIYSALEEKQDTLTFDEEPTDSSTNPVTSGGVFSANAVITASSTTLEGVTISSGSVIRVMFTSAITGSDTSTALSLTYNETAYSVMVGKQGSLSNFVASYVDSTYTYLQAYTTLELAFDGTQFIIIGNPVVISSSDYTIYADGSKDYVRKLIVTGTDLDVSAGTNVSTAVLSFTPTRSMKVRLYWYQLDTMTSNTRNTPYVDSSSGTSYYNTSTNTNLTAGLYYWDLNLSEDITYTFSLWRHSYSDDVRIRDIRLVEIS